MLKPHSPRSHVQQPDGRAGDARPLIECFSANNQGADAPRSPARIIPHTVTVESVREIRRVVRPATPEERARHQKIRDQVATELPAVKRKAREALKRHRVDPVFTLDEQHIWDALDSYAEEHELPNRCAVVRVALSRLLKTTSTSLTTADFPAGAASCRSRLRAATSGFFCLASCSTKPGPHH